jgi:hypothetical protein
MTTRVEYEPEQEVDLGRYASALAARWWLLLAGLVAGAAVGYLLAVGGSDVYRAQALVDLGSPQAPGGGGTVQNPGSLVTQGREIARSDGTVRAVARAVGMRPGELRSGLSVEPVSGAGRAAATTLLGITVRGGSRRDVPAAANALAAAVADRVSPYVEDKIDTLENQIEADQREIASLERRIDLLLGVAGDRAGSSTERLVAAMQAGVYETRRATTRQSLTRGTQELALAENVERPRIVDRATAVKTTARSRRNSAVVGAVIGLLLGLVAALAWQPAAAAIARRRE